MSELAEHARRGAALLDDRRPGWAREIAVDRLDMGDCDRCILGQLYGDYGYGLDALGTVSVSGFGFDGPPWKYPQLAAAWRAEIRARTGGPDAP